MLRLVLSREWMLVERLGSSARPVLSISDDANAVAQALLVIWAW
jgi:hypothetical protein